MHYNKTQKKSKVLLLWRYFAFAQYDSGTYMKVSNKKTVVKRLCYTKWSGWKDSNFEPHLLVILEGAKATEGPPKEPLPRRCFACAQHDSGLYINKKKRIKKSDRWKYLTLIYGRCERIRTSSLTFSKPSTSKIKIDTKKQQLYLLLFKCGRGERIRTFDLMFPKHARYQAAPHPVINDYSFSIR